MGQDGQAKKASAPLLNPRASTPQRGRGCPLQPHHLLAVAVGGSCATGSAECGSSKGAPAELGGRSWPLPSSASQARRPKSAARALLFLSRLSPLQPARCCSPDAVPAKATMAAEMMRERMVGGGRWCGERWEEVSEKKDGNGKGAGVLTHTHTRFSRLLFFSHAPGFPKPRPLCGGADMKCISVWVGKERERGCGRGPGK